MQIPDYFLHKAARQFGDVGPDWVRALPSMLARCLDRWQLTDCIPADNLSINLVCYATSVVHGDVVLKIDGPHDERFTEMAALQLYAGRHACKCIDADEEIAAMLLERIVPGLDLRSLPSKKEQLEVGAELIARLPIPVSEGHGFPHYIDWITKTIAITHADYNPDVRTISLMAAADELFREICPNGSPQVLLHGDLHHENMLQDSNGEWKVIDPQGVIGAPFMESARFIQNHVFEEDRELSLEALDETVAYFAERLGETKRTIGGALYVLHVLSFCWGYQMNYSQEQINRGVDEWEHLLRYVNNI